MINKSSLIEFDNGYVINPDKYYSPSYRISPFKTEDIVENIKIPLSNTVISALDKRFAGRKWIFTNSGKESIALSLQMLSLKPNDCVTIFTTTNNFYISSCVTKEIEKVCKWSRSIEQNTAAIFVNHEFGYPYRNLDELRSYGYPIIEDSCHSFLANTPSGNMGQVGEFAVYSLPKIFPLQMGGILSFDSKYNIESPINKDSELFLYLNRVLSKHIEGLEQAKKQRIINHYKLATLFDSLGCTPRFDLLTNDVPGVFIFTVPEGIDLEKMKQYGWDHGIECSVFYGERSFFIPVHQRLVETDLDYFKIVFQSFFKRQVYGIY
jgi:hypothetical protein